MWCPDEIANHLSRLKNLRIKPIQTEVQKNVSRTIKNAKPAGPQSGGFEWDLGTVLPTTKKPTLITDQGVAHLQNLTSLRRLSLQGASIGRSVSSLCLI